jgi:hypothetical protein
MGETPIAQPLPGQYPQGGWVYCFVPGYGWMWLKAAAPPIITPEPPPIDPPEITPEPPTEPPIEPPPHPGHGPPGGQGPPGLGGGGPPGHQSDESSLGIGAPVTEPESSTQSEKKSKKRRRKWGGKV